MDGLVSTATHPTRGAFSCAEATMENSHFVVSQRDSAWQFSFKGDITGPFATRDAAIDAAIAAAEASDDPDVEVLVRAADMRTESVWRPGTHQAR